MPEPIRYDDWEKEYEPVYPHVAKSDDENDGPFCGAMFEINERQEMIAAADAVTRPADRPERHIWTLIQCEQDDEGRDTIIVAGYRVVNRLGFFVTKKAWSDRDQEVIDL